MTYFGKDLSKYQGTDQVTPDFVILNVEDPYFGSKVAAAYDHGIRWDIYKWCYAGATGHDMVAVAKRNVDAAWRPGTRYPQFWLDYEDGGVAPWQINDWYAACDLAGVTTGLYTYLYLINAQGLVFTRDGWIAYYPNNGAPWTSSYSDEARRRGAKIHQWSSVPIDQDVVLDDAWLLSGAVLPPMPPPPPLPDLSFLNSQEGNVMALVPSYLGEEWDLSVNPAGQLIRSSVGVYGAHSVDNEVVLTGLNPNVQPAWAVENGNLVVVCQGTDGKHRRRVWVPNTGWVAG